MKRADRTKRAVSLLHVPDHGNRHDPALGRFGIPDMMVVIKGVQLWAHYDIMSHQSQALQAQLHSSNLDHIWGRTLVIRPGPSSPRSVQGVMAWLRAIYPPQGLPSPEHLQEVESLAREFRMEALLHQMKLGIAASFDLSEVAAHEQEAMRRGAFDSPIASIVLEAMSEFALDELKEMPGYNDLSVSVKLQVARQRVALLERILEHDRADLESRHGASTKQKVVRACVLAHPQLFRACPEGLRVNRARFDDGMLDEEEESQSSTWTPSVAGVAYTNASSEITPRLEGIDRTRMPSNSITSASQERWRRTSSGTVAAGARQSTS